MKRVSSIMQLFLPVEYIECFINEYFRDNLQPNILYIYSTDMKINIINDLTHHQ